MLSHGFPVPPITLALDAVLRGASRRKRREVERMIARGELEVREVDGRRVIVVPEDVADEILQATVERSFVLSSFRTRMTQKEPS